MKHYKSLKFFIYFLILTIFIGLTTNSIFAYSYQNDDITLIILHTNDLHGHLKPQKDKRIDKFNPVGGSAYMTTVIKNIKQSYPGKVLLLDAGDLAQGTPISNYFKGISTIEVMNKMGYDLLTVGNHEFDWQLDSLQKMVNKAKFTILCSNVVYENDPKKIILGLKPYVIKKVNGIKIGILGILTDETPKACLPKNVEGLKFLPPIKTIKKYIPIMKKDGADIIILLSHSGLFEDTKIAKEVKDIDIIIGGHSHSIISTPKKINNTIILQAGSYGKYLGRLVLKIDKKTKKIISYTPCNELIPIIHGKDLKPDPEVQKIITHYEDIIKPIMSKVIAKTEVDLPKFGNKKYIDSPLGNLITDSLIEETKAQVALYNTPGIRGELYKGNITMEKIYTVIPFDNLVVTFDLPGNALLKVLEHGTYRLYNTLQVSGITFDVDYSKPRGSRISNVKVKDKPLKKDKIYKVSTIDFLLYGGDNFNFKKAKNSKFSPNSREIFTKYLKKHKIIKKAPTGRIKVL